MSKGDEGKEMSILEYISDEPVDCDPYLSYLIDHYKGHYQYWAESPNTRDPNRPTTRECVLAKIDSFLIELECAQNKLRRERSREAAQSVDAVDPVGGKG